MVTVFVAIALTAFIVVALWRAKALMELGQKIEDRKQRAFDLDKHIVRLRSEIELETQRLTDGEPPAVDQ